SLVLATLFSAKAPATPTFLAPAPLVACALKALAAGAVACTLTDAAWRLALPAMSARLPAAPLLTATATPRPNVLPPEDVPVVELPSAVADEVVLDEEVTWMAPADVIRPLEVMAASVVRVARLVRAKAPARPMPPALVDAPLLARLFLVLVSLSVAPPWVESGGWRTVLVEVGAPRRGGGGRVGRPSPGGGVVRWREGWARVPPWPRGPPAVPSAPAVRLVVLPASSW